MKTNWHLALAAFLTLCACAQIEPEIEQNDPQDEPQTTVETTSITISVETDILTKTSFGEFDDSSNSYPVYWSTGDKIDILVGSKTYTSEPAEIASDDATSAVFTFTVDADVWEENEDDVLAVYPSGAYQSNAYVIPAAQTAAQGSADAQASILSGTFTKNERSIVFGHKAAYCKMSLNNLQGSVSSVVLTAPEGTALCSEGNEITINTAALSGEDAIDVWVSTLGCSLSSLTVAINYADGSSDSKVCDASENAIVLAEGKVVAISVTFPTPLTETLYLIGDATTYGWSLDNALELTNEGNGIFTITAKLKSSGVFKFMETRSDWIPSYNRDASDETSSTLIRRTSYSEADESFSVSEDGNYSLKLDLNALSIKIEYLGVEEATFNTVYFVSGESSVAMTADPLRENLWYYGAVLSEQEFCFAGDNSYLYATAENAAYTSQDITSEGSYKWKLSDEEVGKAYRIYVDVASGSEKMVMSAYEAYAGVYIVGDAAPNGWSLDSATELSVDEEGGYVYSWTGTLSSGELKISLDKQSNWMGKWLMAASNGAEPTGEEEVALFVDKSDSIYSTLYPDYSVSDIDQKWKISEAGTYTVEVNVLTQTVKISK